MPLELNNYQKVITTLSKSMHLRFTDESDSANGITEPEHRRRHYLWLSGVLAGLAYATDPDYVRNAARVASIVRNNPEGKEFAMPFLADFIARELSDQLTPLEPDRAKLEALGDAIANGDRPTTVLPVRAEFGDEGELEWVDKNPKELPLPTWRETFEEWQEVE